MSGAQELAEQIGADKERVAEAGGRIGAAKDAVAEVAAQAQALGLGRVAEALAAVERLLEEAESGRQTLEGSLEKARWQVMAAIHGVGPGAPTSRYGESTGGPDGAPPPGVPDILPPHLRTGDPDGEELMGQDPSLSPFEKEHENADADQGKSKFQRFSRKLVRNVGDISSTSKATAKSAYQDMKSDWEPPSNPQVYETVGVPSQPPTTIGPQAAPKAAVEDTVASMVVLAVVAVEGVSRFVNWKKGKRDGRLRTVPRDAASSGLRERRTRQ